MERRGIDGEGELLMTYETDPAKLNGHDKVQARYNMVKKFGCVPERFAKVYNRLNEMRGPGSLSVERPLNLTIDRAKEMLSDARDMHSHLSERIPERGVGAGERIDSRLKVCRVIERRHPCPYDPQLIRSTIFFTRSAPYWPTRSLIPSSASRMSGSPTILGFSGGAT